MLIRTLDEARANRNVGGTGWDSSRLLLKKDGMGFSFHITRLHAGHTHRFWYKNHLESVYIISGTGWIRNLENDERYELGPGVLYALDKHDRHEVHADTEIECACVFNPPLSGRETHDADGAYHLDAEEF